MSTDLRNNPFFWQQAFFASKWQNSSNGEKRQIFEATVLTGVATDMNVARNKIFGTIAPIIGFDSEDEVVGSANDSKYGLASYLYTRDLARA